MLSLPNLLTLSRILAVPILVFLLWPGAKQIGIQPVPLDYGFAFILYCLMGITDYFDGYLARAQGTVSKLGVFLDPIADKALLVSVYVTLASIGVLPDWLAILVVFRDLLIVGGVLVLWAVGLPPRIKPIFISKANTAAQILLAALVLLLAGFGFGAPLLLDSMIWLVAATTFASGAAYVVQAARRTAGWTA